MRSLLPFVVSRIRFALVLSPEIGERYRASDLAGPGEPAGFRNALKAAAVVRLNGTEVVTPSDFALTLKTRTSPEEDLLCCFDPHPLALFSAHLSRCSASRWAQ